MKYNIKGLVLETVGEVLLEGRLEDVKAKYDEDFADIIDDLSGVDPSGNNKYLAWMANQYFKMDGISLDVIGKLIGRYHSELPRINSKMSTEVVTSNPDLFPGKETKRVSNNPKDINSFSSMDGLSKVIEAAEENVPVSNERDKIYQDDKWTVIVPKTHKASCKYGVHSTWCVSVDNSHYFENYTSRGMLAFVLWKGKQVGEKEMSKDGEYKVAAYIKYDRPQYESWEWFNKKDTRMDNDLPLAIFPPELISAIQNQVQTHMRNSGYLVDVDVDELREKAHMLKEYGNEGEMSYTFIPKKEFGLEWLKKYDKQNSHRLNNSLFDQKLLIYTVSEPRGSLNSSSIDMVHAFNKLTEEDYWARRYTKKRKFMNSLPYGLRNSNNSKLDETKLNELWEYFKTYFVGNFNGYLEVNSSTLRIGDEVKWDRKPRRVQRELGSKVGTITKQTPSGMFVVDVVGEDKPSRFKPSPDKQMKKKFNYNNLQNTDNLFTDDPEADLQD
jgi:hypothetical protein